MATTRYLSVEYVTFLHDLLVEANVPGSREHLSRDVHNPPGLASAIARPSQRVQSRFVYRGLARKGAALFHSLIANHPFTDGNKRTAVMALDHFLILNTHALVMSQEELIDLALLVADRKNVSHAVLLDDLTTRIREKTAPFSWISKNPEARVIVEEYQQLASGIRKLNDHPKKWSIVAYNEMIKEMSGQYSFWKVWKDEE